MKTLAVMLGAAVALFGCADTQSWRLPSEGPFYWARPGATVDSFLADSKPCAQAATFGATGSRSPMSRRDQARMADCKR